MRSRLAAGFTWIESTHGCFSNNGAIAVAERALAALESEGGIEALDTQNVDGLYQQAGSTRVIDLHGRLDQVACLGCGARLPRAELQHVLLARNPGWERHAATVAPDGDADLDVDFSGFDVPACAALWA